MCGGSDKAAKAAEKRERERQEEIKRAQSEVDRIFGSPGRESAIQDVEAATRELLQSDLDRQKRDADLQTKFALARGGLTGGSVDIDKHSDLAELYLRSIVEAERRSRASGAALRTADAQSKAELNSMILAGLDAGRAGQQAQSAMRNNYLRARNEDLLSGFDNLFGNLGDFWKTSKTLQGERRAAYDFNSLYGSRGAPTGGLSGGF